MTKDTKLILKIYGIVLLVIAVLFMIINRIDAKRFQEAVKQRVYIDIFFNADRQEPDWDAFFPLEEVGGKRTVLAVLQHMNGDKLELFVDWTGDAATVVSMHGLENGPEGRWVYFVNGQRENVPPNQQQVKYGDRIVWRYVK